MKLTFYSSQTHPKQDGWRTPRPRISFGKNGVISINPAGCQLIGLKPGEKLTLAQDEEDPLNWYLWKDKESGFELRAGYKEKGCLFNHSELVKIVIQSAEKDPDSTHSFAIAPSATTMKGSKTEYWGILIT